MPKTNLIRASSPKMGLTSTGLTTLATIRDSIVIDPMTGCWNWQRYINKDGYGVIYHPELKKNRKAHRAAYEAFVEQLPDDVNLTHLCRNRACCNPSHLTKAYAFTSKDILPRKSLLRGLQESDSAYRSHLRPESQPENVLDTLEAIPSQSGGAYHG